MQHYVRLFHNPLVDVTYKIPQKSSREAERISYIDLFASSMSLSFRIINESSSHNSALKLARETLDIYAGVTKIGSPRSVYEILKIFDRTLPLISSNHDGELEVTRSHPTIVRSSRRHC